VAASSVVAGTNPNSAVSSRSLSVSIVSRSVYVARSRRAQIPRSEKRNIRTIAPLQTVTVSIPVSRTKLHAGQSVYLVCLRNHRGRYVENRGRDCDTLSTEQLRPHRMEPFDRRDRWEKSR